MIGAHALEERKGQNMMHTYTPKCPYQVSTFNTLWNQRNNPDKILKLSHYDKVRGQIKVTP